MIDTDEFAAIAKVIADLANKCWATTVYTIESVEIVSALRDYNDGKGIVKATVAALRNPIDYQYDLRVDILGPPSEALKMLQKGLEVMVQENYVEKIKTAKQKITNQKLN